MKRAKILCLALAALAVLCCASCDRKDTLLSDLEQVLDTVDLDEILDEALPGAELSRSRDGVALTVAEEDARAIADIPDALPETSASGLRPGVYRAESGGVLTVNADGTCAYETKLPLTVTGHELSEAVIFHGAVADGVFSFTQVTCCGMDITALIRQAGYEFPDLWESEAAALYGP